MSRNGLAWCILLAAGACSQGDKQQKWGSGYSPDLCIAAEESGQFVTVQLSRLRGWSGVSIGGPAFASLPPESDFSRLTLEVAGEPVRARAAAPGEGAGKKGIFFAFNPRPILLRHPDGFELAVKREGRQLYAARLHGAAEAFAALTDCDTKRMMGRDPSSRPWKAS